jgi:hypothetical protein
MARGRPATIDQVIERMRAIDAELSPRDGVACFNRLYLRVTENIQAAVAGGQFKSSAFLERLDVVFAGFYLDAYRASRRAGGRVPRAWAPLFEARRRRTVAPIQFALAGMNAHINHDLPLALVATTAELGSDLHRPSREWDDFLLVNAVLERTEAEVKRMFARGWVGEIDRAFGRLDDVLAMWSVARARDQAWTAGETLEELARVPPLRESYLTALGRWVGFAGRGLLVPTATTA